MQLIIDNREPKEIISIIKTRINNIELKNLDLGDFVINDKDGNTIMIFERKSIQDLISSIKDGRYNEQSYRLNEYFLNNHNIYYIIEGNIMNFCSRANETIQKMLFSSMLSLSYKKGFSILHTSNLIETSEFIIRFYEKLISENKNNNLYEINNKEELSKKISNDNSINSDYCEVIKSTKKSNITKKNINQIMLSQIPGISIVISQEIMLQFNTLDNLVNCLKNDNNCLDNIKIKCKNGERKMGKNIIASLKEFLL